MDNVLGDSFRIVPTEDLLDIPVGSVILVGDVGNFSVWFVFTEGKAEAVDKRFPYGETEDLDWFAKWNVVVIGFNAMYTAVNSGPFTGERKKRSLPVRKVSHSE